MKTLKFAVTIESTVEVSDSDLEVIANAVGIPADELTDSDIIGHLVSEADYSLEFLEECHSFAESELVEIETEQLFSLG